MPEDNLPKDEEEKVRKVALARCNCLIDWYFRWKRRHGKWSKVVQVITIILTAAIPLIILKMDNSDFVVAVLSATAAIATGFMAVFGWRENYIRYGYTWHTLQTEKYRYLTKATTDCAEEDEEKAARNFAQRMEQIVMAEVTDWRTAMESVQQQIKQ